MKSRLNISETVQYHYELIFEFENEELTDKICKMVSKCNSIDELVLKIQEMGCQVLLNKGAGLDSDIEIVS